MTISGPKGELFGVDRKPRLQLVKCLWPERVGFPAKYKNAPFSVDVNICRKRCKKQCVAYFKEVDGETGSGGDAKTDS